MAMMSMPMEMMRVHLLLTCDPEHTLLTMVDSLQPYMYMVCLVLHTPNALLLVLRTAQCIHCSYAYRKRMSYVQMR